VETHQAFKITYFAARWQIAHSFLKLWQNECRNAIGNIVDITA